MRLFVALPLARELALELARRAAPRTDRFRAVEPEGLHLTLLFLGELEAAEPVAQALAAQLAGAPELRLVLAGTGAFPSPQRARVLWAGVEEERGAEGRLADLEARVEAAARAVGWEPEVRPGRRGPPPRRPHVTVARVLGAPAPSPEAFRAAEVGLDWRPEEVRLVRSELGTGGARHERVAGWPLGAG